MDISYENLMPFMQWEREQQVCKASPECIIGQEKQI